MSIVRNLASAGDLRYHEIVRQTVCFKTGFTAVQYADHNLLAGGSLNYVRSENITRV